MTAGPRVLLVRVSSAGDVIHALPVARQLKEAGAFLAWLVEDRFAPLLAGCPFVDACLVLPRGRWRREGSGWRARWRDSVALREELRALELSVSVDLQGLTKSAIWPWWSGVPRRVGFARPAAGELAPWLQTESVTAGAVHIVDRHLEVLPALGIKPGPARFWAPAGVPATVAAFLEAHDLVPGRFLILNPGAGWPEKCWPVARWAQLAGALAARPALPVVVTWGGAAEQALARAVVDQGGEKCIIAPATDLPELWGLLAAAGLVVAADTGPLHMAVAAGTPTVALFGPTWGERNGPYGPGHRLVQGRCPQHPRCWSRRGRAACRCMETVTVPAVLAACREQLEGDVSCS